LYSIAITTGIASKISKIIVEEFIVKKLYPVGEMFGKTNPSQLDRAELASRLGKAP